jgi:hypothetical protein
MRREAAVAEKTDLEKKVPMNLQKWDVTIKQIADESSQQPQEAGKQKVLTAWRAKLAMRPNYLPPFQIVREVRKKLIPVSR